MPLRTPFPTVQLVLGPYFYPNQAITHPTGLGYVTSLSLPPGDTTVEVNSGHLSTALGSGGC